MKYFEFVPEGAGTEHWSVTAYLQTAVDMEGIQPHPLPAVVVCPGGGYEQVVPWEAEPVAKPYFAAGYHVFVISYPVEEGAKGFGPLMQLAAVMAHIRRNAGKWMVDAGRIAVCGFSAGGHLAASMGTLYREKKFLEAVRLKGHGWGTENIRPDAMILSYPVILANEYAHKGSLLWVSGAEEGSEEYRYFSLDQHVDGDTPPTFLWHTAEDTCVPVENSLYFAAALSAAKVPFELHILPEGEHGMSVCTKEVGNEDAYNGRWVEWSIRWLERVFYGKGKASV